MSQTRLNKSDDGSEPEQGTSAEYEITDGHCVYLPGNPMKRKDPARRWKDELDCLKGTIWQRIAQNRQMWKQHAEAFAQPWDTMSIIAAQ